MLSVEGEPGRFKVKIKKRARSVDPEKCTGCGTCLTSCPVTNQPYPREDTKQESFGECSGEVV
jgi:heterodisulfide reductase subunit A-like polyferredoxin